MIYEYQCNHCHTVTELVLEGFDAPKKTHCKCGNYAKKIISKSSFLLKGPGWPGKELSMGEVLDNEKSRHAEYTRRKKELKKEGVEFPC
jgi:putative FmdB family regulatory protein